MANSRSRNPTMGHAERPPPNPSLAAAFHTVPAPPPMTPAAHHPRTPRRAVQATLYATCVCCSGNSARCQCKHDSRSRHNKMHHSNEAGSRTTGIVEPDSQDKLKTARFSGGTYSKPDARVKLIPAEDIIYLQHRKPYGRTVGSAGSQKRHCRRSVTPPPSSRKVSLVGSRSPTQNPMPSESPSCKSSQSLSTNLNTDTTRNLDRMVVTQAFARSSSSSILHSHGHDSKKLSVSLPKERVINHMSPSPKQMRAPHPSDNPLGTKAGPSNSVCMAESGKLCSRDINLTTSTTAPVLQAPIMEPPLRSPTSVLSERPVEVYPDTRTALITEEPSVKPLSLTPIPVCSESSTKCKKIPPKHSQKAIASVQHGALSRESNSGASINHGRSSGAPVLHTNLHKKHYQSEACWKGKFHVTGELIHTCDGLEAHFPSEISVRVYEALKQMPEILNLEAVPLSQLWPKIFKLVPPNSQDIGLWFVSSRQRPHRSFDHLLEKVCSHTGMFTKIGDTELAIFSSKLLAPHDQRKNDKLYLWGVFGKHIRKKPRQPKIHIKNVKISNPSHPNDSCNKNEVDMNLDVTKAKEKEDTEPDIGMTLGHLGASGGNPTDVTEHREIVRDNYEGTAKALDLTGGKYTDRVNECMTAETPESNPASGCLVPVPSFLNGCCRHDSANNDTSILQDSACQPAGIPVASPDLMLDIPPGFSPDVPPGFTKAHCQLQIGTAAVSYADALPSLILDAPPGFPTDIPPGFTEAHRRLPPAISPAGPETCVSTHSTEKKPFIRFSLNVPRPVKMGVPPGFTALNAVKKEPGLPAVDKATDKQTLYAAAAVRKPGKGDEMKITDDKVKIEQDENSEERQFPKIRRLSDLYSRPSDSTETSRPMSAHLSNKFQEQNPEQLMHQRNRGHQAPPKSSAETTIKSPNVNGRIAMNNGADHGNVKARCVCASIEGRTVIPTKGPLAASPGGDLDEESISCRCVVCGEEFPEH